MIWKSKFFDDFVLLPDPRETPEYDDELRVLIALKTDRSLVELEKWPAMRVERTILRNYRDWNISTQYGTRIEHHGEGLAEEGQPGAVAPVDACVLVRLVAPAQACMAVAA